MVITRPSLWRNASSNLVWSHVRFKSFIIIKDMDTTEQEYIKMSNDCKERIAEKNEKIKQLTKIIFSIYGLVVTGLSREDTAYYEEIRCQISYFFDDEFFEI